MLEIMDHKPTPKDKRSVLWTQLADVPAPRGAPLFNSTPGEAAVPKFNVKGSGLNPAAPPSVKAALYHAIKIVSLRVYPFLLIPLRPW